MAINLDALPQSKPEGGGFDLPEPGIHGAVIESQSMKPGAAGPYLEIVLKLDKGGKVWDKLFNSDKPALQYKLGRFMRACRIPLVGEMDLEDLGKVAVGKRVFVDIVNKPNTYNGKTTTRPEVDIFAGDIYYLPEDIETQPGTASGVDAPQTPSGSY